jgi:pilus assembly protein CpaB
MNLHKLMLLVGALIFALVCAIGARKLFTQQVQPTGNTPQTVAVGPEVLVATRTLPIGTIVTSDAVRYQPWPNELVNQTAYFTRGGQPDQQALLGTVVRYTVTAGQPLTQGALIKPNDRGFLAAALAPGMRAIAISVTAPASVSGFVFPGDRVDVILTQEVKGAGDAPPLRASETIVRNMRVLATDQKTDKTVDAEGKTVVTAFSNVTLEATPPMAERIAVAQAIGTLSLSLRPIADDKMELERLIANGEVDVPANAKQERALLMEIASRPQDTGATSTTGGDISRFQPRTIPRATPIGSPPAMPSTARPPVAAAAAVRGPSVTVTRGNDVSRVPVVRN